MSLPAFLDSAVYPFTYLERNGLVDVETGGVGIITDLRTLLVSTLGWSEPSTALFKTPVDAAGRFMDVLVTRIDSTHIEWRVRNAAAVTVCTRRIALGLGGVRYFVSTVHAVVEVLLTDPNLSEVLQAYMVDMAPDGNADHALYVVGTGYRTAANSIDGQGTNASYLFAIDNGTAAGLHRGGLYPGVTDGVNPTPLVDASYRAFLREFLITINFAGTFRWAGRLPHSLLGEGTFFGTNGERKVYIDSSTPATFKAIGLTASNVIPRQLLRKS